jgi:hypothetical protein
VTSSPFPQSPTKLTEHWSLSNDAKPAERWSASGGAKPAEHRSPSGDAKPAERSPALPYAVVYLLLLVCFVATNLTNQTIVASFAPFFDQIARSTRGSAEVLQNFNIDLIPKLVLAPVKDAAFFFSLILLASLVQDSFYALWPALRERRLWSRTLIAMLISSIFILSILPQVQGWVYSKIAIEPFMQETDFFYRRIMMPELANLFHLTGALYIVFFWLAAAFTFALVDVYLKSKQVVLSRLELGSLFTIGTFAGVLGNPGYPEILVLGFTLMAILDFDRTGKADYRTLIWFGLSLLTHESAAVAAFGPLAVFMFGVRFAIAAAALLGLYVFTWLLNFGFDIHGALETHAVSGGKGAVQYFIDEWYLAISAPLFAFKLFSLVAVAAIVACLRRKNVNGALVIASGIGGAAALNVIGIDYTRIASFGTFAALIAIAVVFPTVSMQHRRIFAVLNLATPSFYVVGNAGIEHYGGLYRFLLRLIGL